MAKILKTLRNNWKKSVFFTGLISYGFDYGRTEYQKNSLLRKYCQLAVKFGDVPIQIYDSPRNIVVILNPASNKKKARKEYEKYCAPLLHLSGASVTLLTTDEKYNAISLVGKIPENADALIVAGGDGTISDVITGLLRRLNSDPAHKLLPIGIIPLGRKNSTAKQLYADEEMNDDKLSKFKIMLKATYSIINEVTSKISAMEIENIEINDNDKKLLPIYAVYQLQIGPFRDAESKIDKYWYFGKLRTYASYLFGSYTHDRPVEVDVNYTAPCSGCSKCFNNRLDLVNRRTKESNKRWWHVFVRNTNPTGQISNIDYVKIENPSCGIQTETHLNTIELTVFPEVIENQSVLRMKIGPEKISYVDFVKEGFARYNSSYLTEKEGVQNIIAQCIFLSPCNTQNESWLSIDNEEYEFKRIKIALLHNILSVFTLPQDSVIINN